MTPRLATDAGGTVVWRWEGEAFGETAANEDPDGDGFVDGGEFAVSGAIL